ncbi:MAG: hypothetical protein ACKPAD_16540 [Bacteroidota bacterium]
MVVGTNYIVDQVSTSVRTADNTVKNIKWYQFKIPVNTPSNVVGTGADLKSVNFIRMFMIVLSAVLTDVVTWSTM